MPVAIKVTCRWPILLDEGDLGMGLEHIKDRVRGLYYTTKRLANAIWSAGLTRWSGKKITWCSRKAS